MYKFANGIVVFDEETRDKYIKAGMKLVEEQITIEEVIEETKEEKVEEDENKNNGKSINSKFGRSYKSIK